MNDERMAENIQTENLYFDSPDFNRRFGGVRRLYGDVGLAKLQAAHVVVVGIGGVGSWAAEALARNAAGAITLVDLDNIAESNFNRQIHALDGNIGKAKVTAMRERILSINPLCKVREVEDFITPENIGTMLQASIDEACSLVVIDATDDVKAKVALAAFCRAQQIALITSGGAGGKLDATKIQTADLAHVAGDKLLAKVRNQLRRDYGFPKAQQTNNKHTKKSAKFGIACVYSDEPMIKPEAACEADASTDSLTGLNCAGYGSSVSVTATFGLVCAQLAIASIIKNSG